MINEQHQCTRKIWGICCFKTASSIYCWGGDWACSVHRGLLRSLHRAYIFSKILGTCRASIKSLPVARKQTRRYMGRNIHVIWICVEKVCIVVSGKKLKSANQRTSNSVETNGESCSLPVCSKQIQIAFWYYDQSFSVDWRWFKEIQEKTFLWSLRIPCGRIQHYAAPFKLTVPSISKVQMAR